MRTEGIRGIGRAARRRPAALLLLAGPLAFVVAAACAGPSSSDSRTSGVTPVGGGDILPVITNHSLAIGENRFSLMLTDREDIPVLRADVRVRFFDLTGEEPVLKSEADARFVPLELPAPDGGSGAEHYHGSNGAYVTQTRFDVPGRWGADISVTTDSTQVQLMPVRFDVLADSPQPAVGEPAPPSRQLTLADVADITEIDSSSPPRPRMHDIKIADALDAARPVVVAFATPAFCQTRTCGPVMDTVMDPLYEKYRGDATFIHIEPLELKALRAGAATVRVETALEWGIQTEPWLFVIDKDGRIVARFEGIMALDEVETALLRALEGT